MKRIPLIISMVALLSACSGDAVYRIDGKLSNLEDRFVYAVFESEGRNVVDTIVCYKPGQFRIEQNQTGFNQVTLFFEDKAVWFTIYLEPNERVTLSGDMQEPDMLQAKGGQLNNELSSIRKQLFPLLKERADLLHRFKNEPLDPNDLTSRLVNVNHQLNEQALAYVREHPNEAASVVLIKTFLVNPDDTRMLDELLITLHPDLQDFYLVRELEQYNARAKRTSLGADAPDFTLKNIYGDTVSLDSFSRRHLLLTFIAPWCDMCQTDDLYLNEIYRDYPEDKLGQLLVSLDDDMNTLRNVLEEDSIRWNFVADSAGQSTMMVDLYNVSALPRCFLIDEEGKIILKTDNGVEIKQTLKQIFK
jgi:peroxiredoxin